MTPFVHIASAIYAFLFISTVTSNTCIDKSGSSTSSDTNNTHVFTINIDTNCSASSITIDITYSGYNGNWFGVVFAESMTDHGNNATALVYTTGKAANRTAALYSYKLISEEPDASGVIYTADNDPIEIFTQNMNNTLHLIYSWKVSDDIFTQLNQDTLPFMWARGENDHQLTFHGENHAPEPVTIALAADTCIDKSGSSISSDTNNTHIFTVNIDTNCSASSIIIDITYNGYNGNWFGIVFAESMTDHGNNATALVYTTGKSAQAHRAAALYSYKLISEEPDASGVIYTSDNDPTEISTQNINNTLQLRYSWKVSDDIFNQDTIPFMWARGDDDHQLTFHGENHAPEPVMITLSADASTTENISNITQPQTTIVTTAVKTTEVVEPECGYIVIPSNTRQLARPLDVCTSSNTVSNNSEVHSMRITCDNDVFTRTIYDDDICNGTITSAETIGEDCVSGADCVCGVGSECDYAVWMEYDDTTAVNDTCLGNSYNEMAAVINECTNGVMYECSANNTHLLYEICDEGASNTTETISLCDLECTEREVPFTTKTRIETTIEPTIESTQETVPETTETLEPVTTADKDENKQTEIIIGSVIGAFILVLIIIGICLYVANKKKESGKKTDQQDYDAVGGNETENDTDVEMGTVSTR